MLPKTHYQNSYQPHFDARFYRLKSPSVPLLLPYLTLFCSPPLRSRSCLHVVANAAEDNQQPAILQALLNSTKISLALCSTLSPQNFLSLLYTISPLTRTFCLFQTHKTRPQLPLSSSSSFPLAFPIVPFCLVLPALFGPSMHHHPSSSFAPPLPCTPSFTPQTQTFHASPCSRHGELSAAKNQDN